MCNADDNRKNGFVKIYRSLVKWRWYDDANTLRVFLHLLLTANHKTTNWRNITIERGQVVASLDNLSKTLKLSVQQVRTALTRLKSTHEITRASTNRYTLITVINYDSYQDATTPANKPNNKPTNKRTTNKQQTNNKRITTNKNVKNVKNGKNEKNNNLRAREGTRRVLDNVFISDHEYQKLCAQHGKAQVDDLIVELDAYIDNNPRGAKYKNHYKALLIWAKRGRSRPARNTTKSAATQSAINAISNIFNNLKEEDEKWN